MSYMATHGQLGHLVQQLAVNSTLSYKAATQTAVNKFGQQMQCK